MELITRFYRQMSKAGYHSEVTLKFKERFEKNSDKLFTFLTYDGIPWNNNNAEHAIKALCETTPPYRGDDIAKGN